MNTSGKVLTIFLVIIAILSVSLTSISFFFFKKEVETRKNLEAKLEKLSTSEMKLETEIKEISKTSFLLEEKNKEADERINSLLDDLELEEGLREELKQENLELKELFSAATEAKKALEEKMASSNNFDEKIKTLEARLKKELKYQKQLEQKIKDYDLGIFEEGELVTPDWSNSILDDEINQILLDEEVDLKKITIKPGESSEGRVLSVDTETEFVIVSLGEKDGIRNGQILAVYRGQDYLGDIKITRVQPEMAAADLIPPFSGRKVRKNDQVVVDMR